MYADMVRHFQEQRQKRAEELINKGIFSSSFDITSNEELDKLWKYENNILYRIYRNIITIPRQGILRGCGIFLLLEIIVFVSVFLFEAYPHAIWSILQAIDYIFSAIENILSVIWRITIWCSKPMAIILGFYILFQEKTLSILEKWTDKFVDEVIPFLLHILYLLWMGAPIAILLKSLCHCCIN
ncbi:MAG: hypothetical protein IJ770_01310 [Alphaproteobacteria bacterium]|nr:hypothetical protein [Alphaproteobacteria bacterium]